jgi:hypothetical protein
MGCYLRPSLRAASVASQTRNPVDGGISANDTRGRPRNRVVIARSVSDEAIQFTAIPLDCFGTKVPRNDDDTSDSPSREGIPARGRNSTERNKF